MSAATDAAFCSAYRVTFVGSMMPAFIMSTYSSLSASKPVIDFFGMLYLFDYDRSLEPCIVHDLPDRLFERPFYYLNAYLLVAFEFQGLEGRDGSQQSNSSTGYDPFFNGRPCSIEGILDPRLFLLHLRLGCRTYVDHRNTADEFREPLLEFFLVIVGCRLVYLCLYLFDPSLDLLRVSRAFNDRCIFLIDS